MATDRQIDTILTILSAYPDDQVRAALKRRNAHKRGERSAGGWTMHQGTGEPDDETVDKMKIGNAWYTRDRPAAREQPTPARDGNGGRPKTDLSMQPTDKRCPACGEVMAWEPICSGCMLGRMGFSGRYVCMDSFDHTFYVTRHGIELPNR